MTWSLTCIMCKQLIGDNEKCRQIAGNFDCHVDEVGGAMWGALPIPGFTRSNWMLPSGECLHCIAAVAAMADDCSQKHKTLPKNYF